MYGSYHCSYTLSSKIHPKMLHTLRPHTPFCLEMDYKIVRSPRLQGIRRCAPHALQSGTSNYYIHYSTCAVPNTVHCILYTLQLQLEKKKEH